MKDLRLSFVVGLIILIFTQYSSAHVISENLSPQIISVEPSQISPGMTIKIKGYRLGVNERSLLKVIFLQNLNEYATNFGTGSWKSANLSQGLQEINLRVPDEITAGKCQILIEYNGQRSVPVSLNVLSIPAPPKLIGIRPQITNPGEVVHIEGSAFNKSDSVELIDANGTTYNIESKGISSADYSWFRLPQNIPDGTVRVKIIENGSGLRQTSNSLLFNVKRGPVPLDIGIDSIDSVAAGQWTELVCWTHDPLEQATKIEVRLRQGNLEKRSFITDFKNIFIQIPTSFKKGRFNIQNRVWRKNEVSGWSNPVEYKIAENPVEPQIWAFMDVPLKSEMMFKQDGAKLKIKALALNLMPRAKIPQNLKVGKVEMFTRYLKDGSFTEWKLSRVEWKSADLIESKGTIFSKGFVEASNFNEYFAIGVDSPKVFEMNRHDYLRINGNFFVGSPNEIQLKLEFNGQTINLNVAKAPYLGLLFFKIPGNISNHEWDISIINRTTKTVTKVPIRLRIN